MTEGGNLRSGGDSVKIDVQKRSQPEEGFRLAVGSILRMTKAAYLPAFAFFEGFAAGLAAGLALADFVVFAGAALAGAAFVVFVVVVFAAMSVAPI